MGKYREKLEIVADILSVVSKNNDTKKTKIMYLANLSWDLLNRYLKELVEANLIRFESSDCYTLTSKGKQFLNKVNKYSKRCERVEKQLNHVKNEKMFLENMCFNAKEVGKRDS